MSAKDDRNTEIIRRIIDLSELKSGYTVEIDGKMETVDVKKIRKSFMGRTYNGQQFRNGIVRIIFRVPINGGFREE